MKYLFHIKSALFKPKRLWEKMFPGTKILLYHRVAEVKNDPHLLTVSPTNFEKQLVSLLQQGYRLVSIPELISCLKNKPRTRRTVAISFDDGYADNLHQALPILEKLQIPATIFVTAGMLDSTEPFYWDKMTPPQDRGLCLTTSELQKLASSPLIEIGAHTLTHPNLATIDPENQKREIRDSKNKLEKIIGREIKYFAYPFGTESDFTKETSEIVKQCGFAAAFANKKGEITSKCNLFSLPRNLVRDWNPTIFQKRAL